jgi:hypothetical protein
MKNINKILLTIFLALNIFFISAPLFAAEDYGLAGMGKELGYKTDAVTKDIFLAKVGTIISTVLGLLGVLVLVMIIYYGFIWMTAGGNEKAITEAKDSFQSLIVGLILILGAYAVTSFILTMVSNINK